MIKIPRDNGLLSEATTEVNGAFGTPRVMGASNPSAVTGGIIMHQIDAYPEADRITYC